jgi:hypothetical protein
VQWRTRSRPSSEPHLPGLHDFHLPRSSHACRSHSAKFVEGKTLIDQNDECPVSKQHALASAPAFGGNETGLIVEAFIKAGAFCHFFFAAFHLFFLASFL